MLLAQLRLLPAKLRSCGAYGAMDGMNGWGGAGGGDSRAHVCSVLLLKCLNWSASSRACSFLSAFSLSCDRAPTTQLHTQPAPTS